MDIENLLAAIAIITLLPSLLFLSKNKNNKVVGYVLLAISVISISCSCIILKKIDINIALIMLGMVGTGVGIIFSKFGKTKNLKIMGNSILVISIFIMFYFTFRL